LANRRIDFGFRIVDLQRACEFNFWSAKPIRNPKLFGGFELILCRGGELAAAEALEKEAEDLGAEFAQGPG
jgi:hypothetical protein